MSFFARVARVVRVAGVARFARAAAVPDVACDGSAVFVKSRLRT
jgi:hypothetical protein